MQRLDEEETHHRLELKRLEQQRQEEESINMVKYGGCAILDSGASSGVSSLEAADTMQSQRLAYGEKGQPKVKDSDRRFRF